jgi:hypothetical protein
MVTRASILVLAVAACAPVKSPLLVEALVPDDAAADGVVLDDVELHSIVDVTKGDGDLFDVRGAGVIDALALSRVLQEGASYDETIETVRAGGGTPVAARITYDGTRWVPEDFDAMLYLTMLANFESAWDYYTDVVGDDSAATKEKSLVFLYAQIGAVGIPLLTSDNAAFFPGVDGWTVLRVGAQEGVPLAMSRPVIGHEFQHRVFFQNVFGEDNFAAYREWNLPILTQEGLTDERLRQNVLLKGVDEGLADIFTIGMNDGPENLARAFRQAGGQFAAEGDSRDLEGAFAVAATYENLDDGSLPVQNERCATFGYASEGFNFYCLGTVLARSLWVGADADVPTLRDEVLPHVNAALANVGADIAATSTFEVAFLLERIAAEIPAGARRDAVCASFGEKFSSLMAEVPSCP